VAVLATGGVFQGLQQQSQAELELLSQTAAEVGGTVQPGFMGLYLACLGGSGSAGGWVCVAVLVGRGV
jgi:hypothetical protein